MIARALARQAEGGQGDRQRAFTLFLEELNRREALTVEPIEDKRIQATLRIS